MKPFYSLVKIAPNPASGDNLSIGLILRDESGFRFEFSKNKKNIAKKLLDSKSNVIDYIEEQIILKLKEVNKSQSENISDDFLIRDKLTETYFSYLSRYCNGILQFSSPANIDDQMDDVKFDHLFRLLVDSSFTGRDVSVIGSQLVEESFQSRIQSQLIDKVKEVVHTKQIIDSNMIPSIVTPFEIDCIGKNGSLIGAKSISFLHKKQTISAHVNSYMNVIFHLSDRYPSDNNSFYLISDEPSDMNSPEHKIWEKLLDEEKFTVVNSEQCSDIAEKIEEKNAGKFLD